MLKRRDVCQTTYHDDATNNLLPQLCTWGCACLAYRDAGLRSSPPRGACGAHENMLVWVSRCLASCLNTARKILHTTSCCKGQVADPRCLWTCRGRLSPSVWWLSCSGWCAGWLDFFSPRQQEATAVSTYWCWDWIWPTLLFLPSEVQSSLAGRILFSLVQSSEHLGRSCQQRCWRKGWGKGLPLKKRFSCILFIGEVGSLQGVGFSENTKQI